jgi:CDP-glucose 4,6-dehydratase
MTTPIAGAADERVWAGRRVLVTGATGMIGSWLVNRLVAAGASVVALIRDADPQSELLRSGTIRSISVVSGRLEDYCTVERAVTEHEVDTIFHLGAQTLVGTAVRSPRQTLEANVMGTSNVLETARIHGDLVRRVVVASSDKAYGDQPVLPYTEDTPLVGRHPYDVSKSAADLITHAYSTTYSLPVAVARCGNVFGGGDLNWSRIVPGGIRSLLRGERFVIRSDGTFVRDYIFVEDVVDAYLLLGAALDNGDVAGQAFNFSLEHPVTVLEMFAAICDAVGVRALEPIILREAKNEIHDQYLDSSKAKKALGWQPCHDLHSGLQKTVRWYRDLLEVVGDEP